MISRENLDSGRSRQKQRTRVAILEAAARLLERGERPRLAAAAEEARVSRATVYRYFRSEDALVTEATLAHKFLPTEEILDRPAGSGTDAPDLAAQAHHYLYGYAVDHETEFRAFLRATLDLWLNSAGEMAESPRAGRRIKLFETALEGVRDEMRPETYRRLCLVLPVLSGIEAVVVTRDVCGRDTAEGLEAIEWAIRTLVAAALREES